MVLTARRSRPGDPAALAPRLRVEDVQEIKSYSGRTPLEALTDGLNESRRCFTVVTDDDEIVAMFGVVPSVREDTGIVWLLAAPLLKAHSREFIKQSDAWLDKLHERHPILWNYVDKRNKTHIGWLKLIGANFIAEHPEHGLDKVPFLEFIHVA